MLYADIGSCAFVGLPAVSVYSISLPTFSLGPGVLDTGIVVLLLVGGVQGYLRGGVRQVTGLAGWLLGVTAGLKYMDGMGKGVQSFVTFPDEMVGVVGFAAAFLVVRIVMYSAGTAVLTAMGWMGLRIVDRLTGGALGGLKSALTLSLFLTIGGYVGLPDGATQTESRFYDEVKSVMPWAYGMARGILPDIDPLRAVPHQIIDVFNRSFVSRRWNETGLGTNAMGEQTTDLIDGATEAVTEWANGERTGEPADQRTGPHRSSDTSQHREPVDVLSPLVPYPSPEIRDAFFPEWLEGERSWPMSPMTRDQSGPLRENSDIWGTSRPGFQERAWRHENR